MNNIYAIELEICESNGCKAHQVGEKFRYPQERNRLCPWLEDSAGGMLRVLLFGGTLPWTYSGTPYEKEIDPEGITTEFVRCPDPTAHVIVKITRQKIGWLDPQGQPHFDVEPGA